MIGRVCWAVIFLSAVTGLGQEPAAALSAADLKGEVERFVSQERFAGAVWGVKVVSLDTGKTLSEHNAQKLLSPASNSKLYTVALALDRFGPDYRIRTSLYAARRPDARGTVKGDLVVYGRGDPSFNRRLHGDMFKALGPLTAALTNAGVKRVTGDLIADASYFRGPEFGSGWAWDDLQYYYGAEICALTINDNILQVTVAPGERPGMACRVMVEPATPLVTILNRTVTAGPGGETRISFYRPLEGNVVYASGQLPLGTNVHRDEVTFRNPAEVFGAFYREALMQAGVKVKGKVRTRNWLEAEQRGPQEEWVELGYAESPPMRELAREVQKPSQNLYTDLLLAHVGECERGAGERAETTSEELGIRELKRFLERAGVPGNEVFFEEGSGLSRNNLTTANATVCLLQYMGRHGSAREYVEALPVAGKDGTLRSRMRNTPAEGNMRAKTGSLRWAASLSGYVTSAAGERLVFSLMLNRYYNASRSARSELDAIAVMLAGLRTRSGEG